MNSNLDRIELVLENCDVISIPGKYIGILNISGIEREIHRNAINSFRDFLIARYIAIEIFSEAEEPYRSFYVDDVVLDSTKFSRLLKYNDITRIDLFFTYDEEPVIIYTDWNNNRKNSEENSNQKSYISKLGNLYLLISKDKSIKDVFEMDDINDNVHMDFVKDMYGVLKE